MLLFQNKLDRTHSEHDRENMRCVCVCVYVCGAMHYTDDCFFLSLILRQQHVSAKNQREIYSDYSVCVCGFLCYSHDDDDANCPVFGSLPAAS